jgi:hypothetical protein
MDMYMTHTKRVCVCHPIGHEDFYCFPNKILMKMFFKSFKRGFAESESCEKQDLHNEKS